MAWQGNLPFLRNIKLSSTDNGRIRYVPFSNLFSKKSIILEKRVLWLHLFIFKSADTPPTLLPLSSSNTFEGQGYCGWGVNRTGQHLKTTPAQFFLGVDLVFFKGWRAGSAFYLEKHHYPFDLQVGPPLGTQGGGGVGPFWTNPRINSVLLLLKYKKCSARMEAI